MSQLSASVLSALNVQWTHEKRNQLTYELIASEAEFIGLTGVSAFFRKQAAGEAEHAVAVYSYINDRNERAVSSAVAPHQFATDFAGWFESALAIERETTKLLTAIAADAMAAGDLQTFYWLADLIKEQTEEENLYQTILDRIATCGKEPAMQHQLDLWIGGL